MRLAGKASLRQYVEPMVLGIISENTRMRKVNTPDTTPTKRLVSSDVAQRVAAYPAAVEPTSDAPTVLAMVLTTRMAEIGRSMFVLYCLRRSQPLAPCVSRVVMYDMGVERSVASSTEHSAEMMSDNNM